MLESRSCMIDIRSTNTENYQARQGSVTLCLMTQGHETMVHALPTNFQLEAT